MEPSLTPSPSGFSSSLFPRRKLNHHHIIREFQHRESYNDKYVEYRGLIIEKYVFLLLIIGFSVGFSGVQKLPVFYCTSGGIFYCLMYIITLFVFGIPLMFHEMGLGQFYTLSIIEVYRFVPFFRGFGWVKIISIYINLLPRYIQTFQLLVYFIVGIADNVKWRSCDNYQLKTIRCINYGKSKQSNVTSTSMNLTAEQLFYDIYVESIRRENGDLLNRYIFHLDFNLNQLISLIIFMICLIGLTLAILRLWIIFVFILIVLIYIMAIILLIRALLLPGSYKGIFEFFTSSYLYNLRFSSFFTLIYHLITSLGIGMCVFEVFSSLNHIRLNIHHSILSFVFAKMIYDLIYMMFIWLFYQFFIKNHSINIEKLSLDEVNLLNLILYVLSYENDSIVWFYLHLVMIFFSGLLSTSIFNTSLIICIVDFFPQFFKQSEKLKIEFTLISEFVFFLFLILFTFRGNFIFINTLLENPGKISLCFIVLTELIIIHFIYGTYNYRSDMKLVLNGPSYFVSIILNSIILPILVFASLIYFIVNYATEQTQVPIIFRTGQVTILIIPLFAFIPNMVFECRKAYYNETKKSILESLKSLFRPKLTYSGPHFKKFWLEHPHYRKKLYLLREDEDFLKTIPETENIRNLLTILPNKIRSEKLTNNRDSTVQILNEVEVEALGLRLMNPLTRT